MAAFRDRRKKLVNFHEYKTRVILDEAAGRNGANVYTKPRLADVIDIEQSGLDNGHFSYALRAHFDFVVVDNDHLPLFAVEFDGAHHSRDARAAINDAKKNLICEQLAFPLARVRDEHLFREARGLGYLTWLTELFFAFQALVQAQDEGIIPLDEPLDPMFLSSPHFEGRFPLFISADARSVLCKLHQEGILDTPVPNHFSGYDRAGHGLALVTIRTAGGMCLACSSSIYLTGFGVTAGEVAEEIATVNLAHMAQHNKETGDGVVAPMVVRDKLASLLRETSGHISSAGMGGLGFPVSFQSRDGESKWTLGAVYDAPAIVFNIVPSSSNS